MDCRVSGCGVEIRGRWKKGEVQKCMDDCLAPGGGLAGVWSVRWLDAQNDFLQIDPMKLQWLTRNMHDYVTCYFIAAIMML